MAAYATGLRHDHCGIEAGRAGKEGQDALLHPKLGATQGSLFGLGKDDDILLRHAIKPRHTVSTQSHPVFTLTHPFWPTSAPPSSSISASSTV